MSAQQQSRPESPDDHKRFSLSEDWAATVVGIILLALCLAGLISPEMIP